MMPTLYALINHLIIAYKHKLVRKSVKKVNLQNVKIVIAKNISTTFLHDTFKFPNSFQVMPITR